MAHLVLFIKEPYYTFHKNININDNTKNINQFHYQ